MADKFFDKNGIEFQEFDVVKVFHFTGPGRKKNYMYKWIRFNSNKELSMMHLDDSVSSLVNLKSVCTKDDDELVWKDAEIVQSNFA